MRFLPFAVACFCACVWLNQGRSLVHTEELAVAIEASPAEHAFDRARFPFLFLYRRARDEELYFHVANAIRGVPYDRALLLTARGDAPEAFRRLPPTDGAWHRPYTEVPLEYPAVMLPFVLLPELFTSASFEAFAKVFGLLMAACLLGAAALCIRAQPWRAESEARVREGWWLAAALLLAQGGLAIQRLDAVPALLLGVALWAAVTRRPATLGAAMGLAIAAKFIPALLLPPLLAADRATWRDRRAVARLAGGLGAALVIGFAPMLAPPDALADVLHYHAQRGLQVESTYGALIGMARLVMGTSVPTTFAFGSFNMGGAAADTFAALSAPLGVAAILALTWFLWRRPESPASPASRTDAIASALLVALAILWLTAKVFSPQYMTWAIPIVLAVSGRRGRVLAWLLVACMAITQLYQRGFYDFVTDQRPLGVITLFVRQALLGALLYLGLRVVRGREPVAAGSEVTA
jgi:nitrate reductase gamma subunit